MNEGQKPEVNGNKPQKFSAEATRQKFLDAALVLRGEPLLPQEQATITEKQQSATLNLETTLVALTGVDPEKLNGHKTEHILPHANVFTSPSVLSDALVHPVARALAQRTKLRAEYEAEMAQRNAKENTSQEKPAERPVLRPNGDIFAPRIRR